MRKSKRRKRKKNNLKVGSVVFQAGGVEQNHRMIQVGISSFQKNTSNFFFIELDVQKMMSPEEKKKLFDAIGYEGEDISKSSYPKTVSLGSLNQIDLFPKISVCGYRYEYSIEIIGCEYLVETQ